MHAFGAGLRVDPPIEHVVVGPADLVGTRRRELRGGHPGRFGLERDGGLGGRGLDLGRGGFGVAGRVLGNRFRAGSGSRRRADDCSDPGLDLDVGLGDRGRAVGRVVAIRRFGRRECERRVGDRGRGARGVGAGCVVGDVEMVGSRFRRRRFGLGHWLERGGRLGGLQRQRFEVARHALVCREEVACRAERVAVRVDTELGEQLLDAGDGLDRFRFAVVGAGRGAVHRAERFEGTEADHSQRGRLGGERVLELASRSRLDQRAP